MGRKEFIIILSITFGVIVFWAVADLVFHTNPSVPVDPKVEILTEPISEDFDQQTLQKIRQLVIKVIDNSVPKTETVTSPPVLSPDELESLNLDTILPEPTVEPIPEATDEGSLEREGT